GEAAERILAAASHHKVDLIIMGSYGFSPLLEIFLGSTLDKILMKSKRPILICR
ncbi:MAG: universal stress protein, partial [Anaerolineaceae bacterium]|nr:universal stress protein [Anaerolineaceae bacterium]